MKQSEAKIQKTKYTPQSIELKWQSVWKKEGVYQPDLNTARKPFYNLMMFPYPSAEGLHMGSIYTFTGVDAYGRFKRMQGYDVFEPIGLDGFGINAENHAIKTNTHPIEHAERTEKNFYRQLHETGNGFAWDNKLETYDPAYYRWTQWLFTELFKAGLAYRKESPVNFCPSCKTVLADEQVIDGQCERCGSVVEKRNLEQWFFRITNYAERLLNNIPELNWTEKIKTAQKNWIGKKTGINIRYRVIASDSEAISTQSASPQKIAASSTTPRNDDTFITVFTTRPDTNFGATFVAIAPEHAFVSKLLDGTFHTDAGKKAEIQKYLKDVQNKSSIERMSEGREKSGVFTGYYATNELNGYQMPIWISDFVLTDFGTGALVGVPAHDKRDFEFATKFGLEIKRVVATKNGDTSPVTSIDQVQEAEGTMIDSGFLDGLSIHDATKKIMDYLEEKGSGERVKSYHLRDWLISRQRYWGPPIPLIYCESCAKEGRSWFSTEEAKEYQKKTTNKIGNWKLKIENSVAESAGWYPAEDLPVKLPHIDDYKPMGTGKAPLANYPEFYETTCPSCGAPARRETDVSDTFLDSAWYFLRYLSTDWQDMPFPSTSFAEREKQKAKSNKQIENWKLKIENSRDRSRFLPVTIYIGGAEHSVLHLLYSRFTTMVLHDLGYLDFEEPFARFYAHGLIIKDGAKMSKSKGNVINPDEYIKKYGVDTVRLYLRFLGPFNQTADFRDSGIEGMNRFVKRLWHLFAEPSRTETQNQTGDSGVSRGVPISSAALRMMHQTIKAVTEEMEELRYNTAIAKLMEWYNFLAKQETISTQEVEVYLKLLAPFAPHFTEELYQSLNHTEQLTQNQTGDSGVSRGVPISSAFQSIHTSAWPTYDPSLIEDAQVTIAVQVNGKLRGTVVLARERAQQKDILEKQALADAQVKKFLADKTIKKVICIPGKVVNIVIA